MKVFLKDIYMQFTHKDVFVNILVCVIWGYMLTQYLRGIVNHLPFLCNYTDEIEISCYVLPLALAIPKLITSFRLSDYLIFLFLVFCYLANYAIHPENEKYLNKHLFDCICIAFPMFFIGRIIDIKKYFNVFTLISIICISMNLFYFLHYAQSFKNMSDIANDDNMYTAYRTLPHVLMVTWAGLKQRNILFFFFAILGLLFLISCGTRGPLACFAFFCICYFVFFMNFKYSNYIKIGLISLSILIMCFLKQIIFSMAFTLNKFQLSTRILTKFISGDLGNDSGRSSIKTRLIDLMDIHGNFFGLGYFGSERFGYTYAHHYFIDMFVSYGYIMGTILILTIYIIIAKALYKTKSTECRCFVIMLCSLSVIKLFLSGTFLTEMYFYLLLGYCVSCITNSKKI